MPLIMPRLNRSDHFWSIFSIFWSVDINEAGRLDEDLTDLSGLTDLELLTFLSSLFFFFSAGCSLKPGDPEVLWPSTTPTTDTSAGSIRVGLRVVSEDGGFLAGVEDLDSRFSFLILSEGVESWASCSGVRALQ